MSTDIDHLTQQQRLLRLHTPLGKDVLFAEDVEIWEGIGPHAGPALGDPVLEPGLGASDDPFAPDDPSGPWPFASRLGSVAAGLRLVVHALATDAHLELKTLIGQPVLVELLCQDSRTALRPWHGHVVAAAIVGSDGGLARYRLVVEPWLAALGHRVDARVFQDMSVPRILDDVFAAFGRSASRGRFAPAWRWDLADPDVYAARSLCIQYHESDLAFVQRLMREEGLFCWWEHAGDLGSPAFGRHTLVIADHNGALAPNVQPVVRYTRSDHALGEDSLERWSSVSRVTSASVLMRSRDYRGLGTRPVQADVAVGGSAPMPELVIVDAPGAYAYEDTAQGERLARRQAEALAAAGHRAHARGPWRRAQAGTSFTLADHPRHDGTDPVRDTFVVLAAQHRARNNFSADERARFAGLSTAIARGERGVPPSRDDAEPLHAAALLMQPLALPVRLGAADPSPHAPTRDGHAGVLGRLDGRRLADVPSLFDMRASLAFTQPDVRLNARPTVHGTQTALVVGHADQDLHTDRDGRVRVQFHWQRGTASSHRLGTAEGDNAPASAASFPWLRVGQSLAGANYGAVFTPRIGQEVLVAFLGGDIDRPVVVGSVYNGRGNADGPGNQVAGGTAGATGNAPAWFPGTLAAGDFEGHQHRAVLLGHKSQELGYSDCGLGGSNQLVFDDSPAGNRIELSTTTAATRLQLGALQHQQDNQRLAPRGHGLELATEAHGALRAGAGLLVTAHAQPPSTRTGQQLETQATADLLRSVQARLHTLAESAQAHHARLPTEPAVAGATKADAARQLPVEQALFALHDSLQSTRSAQSLADLGGAPTADAEVRPVATDGGFGTIAAWSRPDLVLAAPAGIGLFTPASTVLSAGATFSLGAGHDLHAVAQRHLSIAARQGVVFYTGGQADDPDKPNTETGIALHAAAGSVQSASHTGATRMTASGAVDVSSTEGSVRAASPRQVLLAAAGAAIRIEPMGITISAPGAVTFQAGMKVLTSGASADAPTLSLPTSAEVHVDPAGPFSARFALHGADERVVDTGFAGLPYTVYSTGGDKLAIGAIGEDGRIPRVQTGGLDEVTLQVGDPRAVLLDTLPRLAPAKAPSASGELRDDDMPGLDDIRYADDLQTSAELQRRHFLTAERVAELLGLAVNDIAS